jgi:hypothetical protein
MKDIKIKAIDDDISADMRAIWLYIDCINDEYRNKNPMSTPWFENLSKYCESLSKSALKMVELCKHKIDIQSYFIVYFGYEGNYTITKGNYLAKQTAVYCPRSDGLQESLGIVNTTEIISDEIAYTKMTHLDDHFYSAERLKFFLVERIFENNLI